MSTNEEELDRILQDIGLLEMEDNHTEEIEEVTFQEIYQNLLLNDEIILEIAEEDEERLKTGIKNVKAKQATKCKEAGLVPDNNTLTFLSSKDPNKVGITKLHIVLAKKATVKVFSMTIPDKEL